MKREENFETAKAGGRLDKSAELNQTTLLISLKSWISSNNFKLKLDGLLFDSTSNIFLCTVFLLHLMWSSCTCIDLHVAG